MCSIFICNCSGNSGGGGATGQQKHAKSIDNMGNSNSGSISISGKVRKMITMPNFYINLEKHFDDGSYLHQIDGTPCNRNSV